MFANFPTRRQYELPIHERLWDPGRQHLRNKWYQVCTDPYILYEKKSTLFLDYHFFCEIDFPTFFIRLNRLR